MGDTVDNVPGVEKVGPKTAAKWIAEHGSLDGVIAAAAGIKGAAGENLRKALDWLPTGKRLVTVVTDCDLGGARAGLAGARCAGAAAGRPRRRCSTSTRRYGFKTLAARTLRGRDAARRHAARTARGRRRPPRRVRGRERRQALRDRAHARGAATPGSRAISAAPLTAIDTETDSLDGMRRSIVGISLAVKPGEAAYIPLRHSYAGAPDQLPMRRGAGAR